MSGTTDAKSEASISHRPGNDLSSRLQDRSSEINELTIALRKQMARTQEYAARLKKREREIGRLKGSVSWRVTAPIREISRLLQSLGRIIRILLGAVRFRRRELGCAAASSGDLGKSDGDSPADLHAFQPGKGTLANALRRGGPIEYGPIGRVLEYAGKTSRPKNFDERICVHLHLFYTEFGGKFAKALGRLRTPYTLLISIPDDQDPSKWAGYFEQRLPFARDIIVRTVPNKGRDVFPWLVVFKDAIKQHDIFCHLHTKLSAHQAQASIYNWRRFLIHSIFGSPSIVNEILELFAQNEKLGLVFPPYAGWLRSQPNWGKNRPVCEEVYWKVTGKMLPEACPDYPAGSFFWARAKILEPLFNANFTERDFETEDGQLDATLAHGIERIIGLLPDISNLQKLCVTVDVAYDSAGNRDFTGLLRRILKAQWKFGQAPNDRPNAAKNGSANRCASV